MNNYDLGKVPPQNIEIEEAVLGANVVLTKSTKIMYNWYLFPPEII